MRRTPTSIGDLDRTSEIITSVPTAAAAL